MSKYLDIIKNLPRITLTNIKENPYSLKKSQQRTHRKRKGVRFTRSNIKPLIGSFSPTPFQKKMPDYGFNRAMHLKRQYLPFSLWQLQNLIDLGRIDPSHPIDINTIANTRCLNLAVTDDTCYGLYLVDQGANIFQAKVNIEVQIADRLSIASIEKHGGTISTAFYDRRSFVALCNPVKYFLTGCPIQKRLLPPRDLVPYYTDPKVRGYLSDPRLLQQERQRMANEFGYELPDITVDPDFEMLTTRKDPRQTFFGLEPGWVVNLADEVVIKPESDYLKEHFLV